MSLADAIAEALANADPPPPNESTTCEWIIYPLLLAAGYSRRDIVSRILDNNGQYPDYTILPDSPHTWFLEAKAWNVSLQDSHAQQSLNYANQNGKRWVVLTNGREWRLYDNTIQGIATNKLVAESALSKPGFTPFISALRKDSVHKHSVAEYADHCRESRARAERRKALDEILSHQLADENSDLIKAIWKVVRSDSALSEVTRTEVLTALTSVNHIDGATLAVGTRKIQAVQDSTQTSSTPVKAVETKEPRTANLNELLTGGRAANDWMYPAAISFPDGSEMTANSWQEGATKIVEWIGRNGTRPALPFRGLPSGNRYFVNSVPDHADRPMNYYAPIGWGSGIAYVHVNRSAFEYVKGLHQLCLEAGIPTDGIRLRMKPWGKAARKS